MPKKRSSKKESPKKRYERLLKLVKDNPHKYRQIFTRGADAIVIFDSKSLRFLDANPKALRLYGYRKSEFLKLTVPDISAEREKTLKAIRTVRKGDYSKIQLRYHNKKDGTAFPVEILPGTLLIENDGRLTVAAPGAELSETISVTR